MDEVVEVVQEEQLIHEVQMVQLIHEEEVEVVDGQRVHRQELDEVE